jgi:hypothetical protein
MSENPRSGARSEYETPELVTHGSVQELTNGTGPGQGDTANASAPLP